MREPASACEIRVLFNGDQQLANQSSDIRTWVKVPIPALDNEDAVRLGRAFNQQIRFCGAKPDPFAK